MASFPTPRLPPLRHLMQLLIFSLLISNVWISTVAAFATLSPSIGINYSPTSKSFLQRTLQSSSSDNNNEDSSDDSSLDMAELSRRISDLAESEKSASETFEAGLQRRVKAVAASDALEAEALQSGTINLPAICFDQLLPNQRLSGRTTDATFGKMLRDLGLGGLFVMISLDPRARKVRRHGVVCRIEYVDVDMPETSSWGGVGPAGEAPTAVDFRLVGRSRCRVVGPCENMVARVGRWRRGYDPDGEEAVLGFGEERFIDSPFGVDEKVLNGGADFEFVTSEWTPVKTDTSLANEKEEEVTQEMIDWAERIVPLLDKWIELAANMKTYDNTDVVATARIKHGEHGLLTDPERHIKGVLSDLGKRPSTSNPTEFCFWGAALVNPLPPLGVSLEVRGRMLEAKSIEERLGLLERTVTRSIQNLDGTRPL